jgi:hypothetical protein
MTVVDLIGHTSLIRPTAYIIIGLLLRIRRQKKIATVKLACHHDCYFAICAFMHICQYRRKLPVSRFIDISAYISLKRTILGTPSLPNLPI